MKKLLVAALAVGTMFAFAPVAHAAVDPSGFTCGFNSVTDPQVEGSQTGEIDGGPLVFTDDTDPAVTYTGKVVCTIQTGTNDTHGEADAALPCEGNVGTVSVAACTVTYEVGSDEDVYLCTSAVSGNTTLYWDSTAGDGAGGWSTSSTAPCDLAISASSEPVEGPLDGLFDLLNDTVCPVLVNLPPPLSPTLGEIWGDCYPV